MSIKAWKVSGEDGEGFVIFAETRGQARMLGAWDLDEEFTNVSATRAPSFDALVGKTLTPRDYIERNWWYPCAGIGCSRNCYGDDEDVCFDNLGTAYCSEKCRASLSARAGGSAGGGGC